MSMSAEAPHLDQPSTSQPDPELLRRLSNERSGALVSLALIGISKGLIGNLTPEQQAVADEAEARVQDKLSLTETKAIMAGVSVDSFVADDIKSVSGFYATLGDVSKRLRTSRRVSDEDTQA